MKRRVADPAAAPCPCGRGAGYGACCGRWHAGPTRLGAPDAETLMRSRYAAYALGLHDYLLDTWHPSSRPPAVAPDAPGTVWLGLEVRAHRPDGPDRATVEFVARCRVAGRGLRLHETSRFVLERGRWWYVDGDLVEAGGSRTAAKP
ncbi:MAG TPA: YchJ family metal-binding protein [Burkholderiaceae bacterium]|nr:YchJ family metal-binding protein [Burkholderiaceae bacterium]